MDFFKPGYKLFNMSDAEFKRTFMPKSLQWRANRLAETLTDLVLWWKPLLKP